jgi:putative Mg2+ transporter-C (MgtC) family protein
MDTSVIFGSIELQFLIGIALSVFLGYLIGYERELRHKDAGISTHVLVIAGAMTFTLLSAVVDPNSTSRIASQIVVGIGFLGAGLILKDGSNVRNLTTAASVWYAAAIGMALGFGFYGIAIIAAVVGALAPRIPHARGKE